LSFHVNPQSKIEVRKPIHLGALRTTYNKSQKTSRIVLKKVIKNDPIPAKVRWKKSASGVGKLFDDVSNMLDEDNRKK